MSYVFEHYLENSRDFGNAIRILAHMCEIIRYYQARLQTSGKRYSPWPKLSGQLLEKLLFKLQRRQVAERRMKALRIVKGRIRVSQPWDEEVQTGLRNSQVLLALLSPQSVCRSRDPGNPSATDSVWPERNRIRSACL
jgi:hypothetical protein